MSRVTSIDDASRVLHRFEKGEAYLLAFDDCVSKDWFCLEKHYLEGNLKLSEIMVLVHPWFYEEYDLKESDPNSIRCGNKFGEVGRSSAHCCSDRIWLRDCLLRTENMHADHVFPYSLGGPTLPENQQFLCPTHNAFKSNDVHVFPWEEGEPSWVKIQIEKISKLLRNGESASM